MGGPLTAPGATRALARFVVTCREDSLPASLRHEAKRALLNWVGCALGGSRSDALATALATVRPFAGGAQATVMGRADRLDCLHTALLNGIGSNLLDFDDTHLRTVMHTTVPVASALLALAEWQGASGPALVHAFVLGFEAACRIGNAVSPGHFEHGWHISGTCGVFGAAAACGRLLQLDEQRMTWALGLAATQAAGITGMLGSMAKPYNMGHAARNGLLAALLARDGFTSSEVALEGPRGFLRVFASREDTAPIVADLGTSWELPHNAYKPYPCGIVIHPVIDACLALRAGNGFAADAIEAIALDVHPLVTQVTANAVPASGLEAKLSVQHCAAAALLRGEVGVAEFTEESVMAPELVALRSRVRLSPDETLAPDAASVTLRLRSGDALTHSIAHAIGSRDRPMTDDELIVKFQRLYRWWDDSRDSSPLLDLLWRLDSGGSAAELIAQCRPSASKPDPT